MVNDPEIEALAVIVNALKDLPDDESRGRVLTAVNDRFGVPAT